MSGNGSINLCITEPRSAPVSVEGFSLLQSQGILDDGPTFQVSASSCGVTEAIPVGDHTTCFLSGFDSEPNVSSQVTLAPVSGDGSTIVVPVNSAEIEIPTWRQQAIDRDCQHRIPRPDSHRWAARAMERRSRISPIHAALH